MVVSSGSRRGSVEVVGMLTAVVLCGGLATRMEGSEYRCSKAMLPVCGRPFLWWTVNALCGLGAQVLLAAGVHTPDVIDFFSEPTWRARDVSVIVEQTALGTGGAIRNALSYAHSQTVLAVNADTIVRRVPARSLVEWHLRSGFDVTQVVSASSNQNQGMILVAGDRVVGTLEHAANSNDAVLRPQVATMSSTGLYAIARAEALHDWPAGACSLEHQVMPSLIDAGSVGAYRIAEGVYDFGTPQRVAEISVCARELESMFVEE